LNISKIYTKKAILRRPSNSLMSTKTAWLLSWIWFWY